MNAGKPIGPYSPAVEAGDLVFVSGQIPIDPVTSETINGDIEEQASLVIDKVEEILSSFNLTLDDVVKADVFLSDIRNFETMNKIYAERFSSGIRPARCVIEVANLPKSAKIELSCIAKRAR